MALQNMFYIKVVHVPHRGWLIFHVMPIYRTLSEYALIGNVDWMS